MKMNKEKIKIIQSQLNHLCFIRKENLDVEYNLDLREDIAVLEKRCRGTKEVIDKSYRNDTSCQDFDRIVRQVSEGHLEVVIGEFE